MTAQPTRRRAGHSGALLVLGAILATLVLVVGCSSSKPPPPRPLPPNVRRMPDGTCWYFPPGNCPPSHLSTCEAQVARQVACPY